jgi:two-component system, OmpR family, alkaline phosphatase synthesis response regulator PhoP
MDNEKKIKILVVDDEVDLCEILKFNLETEGYCVETAFSGEEALSKPVATFNLVLLDIMMGGISGFEVASKLRKDSSTKNIPIIFLTAKGTENDKITGFNVGADDYISKPFSIREVILRVRAVLRRTEMRRETASSTLAHMLEYEGLVIDLDRKTVSVDGNNVDFTKTELGILRILLEHTGHVFSREDLIMRVWPNDVIVSDRTVDVNITRLRKKLGAYADHLVTRTGFGYCFDA